MAEQPRSSLRPSKYRAAETTSRSKLDQKAVELDDDSDDDGEEDAPNKPHYVTLQVQETYEDDAPVFAYESLQVLLRMGRETIPGFKLHPKRGSE